MKFSGIIYSYHFLAAASSGSHPFVMAANAPTLDMIGNKEDNMRSDKKNEPRPAVMMMDDAVPDWLGAGVAAIKNNGGGSGGIVASSTVETNYIGRTTKALIISNDHGEVCLFLLVIILYCVVPPYMCSETTPFLNPRISSSLSLLNLLSLALVLSPCSHALLHSSKTRRTGNPRLLRSCQAPGMERRCCRRRHHSRDVVVVCESTTAMTQPTTTKHKKTSQPHSQD